MIMPATSTHANQLLFLPGLLVARGDGRRSPGSRYVWAFDHDESAPRKQLDARHTGDSVKMHKCVCCLEGGVGPGCRTRPPKSESRSWRDRRCGCHHDSVGRCGDRVGRREGAVTDGARRSNEASAVVRPAPASTGDVDRRSWWEALRADPLPWLLEESTPEVRHQVLRDLLDRPDDDVELRRTRDGAMRRGPIATILSAQHPEGFWGQPGTGYYPKYTGTAWQVIFLDQLGADGADVRVRRACEYLLAHAQASSGGFGARTGSDDRPPPPSATSYCLTGNLLHALIGFGYLSDERVRQGVDWLARMITGEGIERYYAGSGPLFACGSNGKLPCAWGAVKAMRALARVPSEERTPQVQQAIARGTAFLLSRDPVVADYPMGLGNTTPSRSWFKLGFPSGYVTDVLQNLEVLCELGQGTDPRLRAAIDWVVAKQDASGRWRNEYAYTGKTLVDIDQQGTVSKWVTLRACRMLKRSTTRLVEAE